MWRFESPTRTLLTAHSCAGDATHGLVRGPQLLVVLGVGGCPTRRSPQTTTEHPSEFRERHSFGVVGGGHLVDELSVEQIESAPWPSQAAYCVCPRRR